jgi:hypothetical protein
VLFVTDGGSEYAFGETLRAFDSTVPGIATPTAAADGRRAGTFPEYFCTIATVYDVFAGGTVSFTLKASVAPSPPNPGTTVQIYGPAYLRLTRIA